MKALAGALLAVLLISLPASAGPDQSDMSWISDSIVVVNTETVNRDMDGRPTGMTVMHQEKINASRTVTEGYNKNGSEMEIQWRKTEIRETSGGKTIIEESRQQGSTELIVKKIYKEEKTPSAMVRTTRMLDETGVMRLVERVTSSRDSSGMTTTTVEKRDKSGDMVVVSETTQY